MKLFKFPFYALVLVSIAVFSISCENKSTPKSQMNLYIGTYGDSLYHYSIDTSSYEYQIINSAAISNSSYLALSDNNDYLFAITESGDDSKISSFSAKDGITLLSSLDKVAKDPCYITYYKGYLFTADYSGGSISVYPTENGTILPPSQVMQFAGKGPNEIRQIAPHVHSVRILSDSTLMDDYLIASDLGCDKLYIFRIDNQDGKITCIPNNPFFIKTSPGSGPRHFEFDTARKQIYLLSELSGTVSVFNYQKSDDENISLSLKQDIVVDSTDIQASADIHIHPNGKYLYSSHRKLNDRIAIMNIEDDGTLSIVGYQPTAVHPRNFIINDEGTLMLVASKDEQLIQIFSIDPNNGLLRDTGHTIEIESGQPVCIVIE